MARAKRWRRHSKPAACDGVGLFEPGGRYSDSAATRDQFAQIEFRLPATQSRRFDTTGCVCVPRQLLVQLSPISMSYRNEMSVTSYS